MAYLINKNPLISVLIPIYNAEAYLHQSIESIVNQTYRNLEILIYNDASTDNSITIINSFQDSRIKIISHETNRGYIFCLNSLLSIASGDFIARMDADDISLLDRFSKQLKYLQDYPECDLVSSEAILIDKNGLHISKKRRLSKLSITEIQANFFFSNLIVHSSVFFRRALIDNGEFKYNDYYHPCEDYYLWTSLLLKGYKISILNEYLVKYRVYPEQTTSVFAFRATDMAALIRANFFLASRKEAIVNIETLINFHSGKLQNSSDACKILAEYCNFFNSSDDYYRLVIAKWMRNYVNMNFKKFPKLIFFYRKMNCYSIAPYSIRQSIKFFLFYLIRLTLFKNF